MRRQRLLEVGRKESGVLNWADVLCGDSSMGISGRVRPKGNDAIL